MFNSNNVITMKKVIENAMDVQMEKFDDLLDHGVVSYMLF